MIIKTIDNRELIKDKIYKLPNNTNEFRFIGELDLNKIMFVRVYDNQEHFGREFIEFKNGIPYFSLKEKV